MLGGFRLLRESAPVEFSSKGPGRPVELLKVLVALGGHNVRVDQIADALWPRVDADYAHKSFTATLHRLRRILDEEDALILRDARLSLNPRCFWVDTWALDRLLVELDDALRDPRPDATAPALRALTDEALGLYRGPFLPDESEQPGYIACREDLAEDLVDLKLLTGLTTSQLNEGLIFDILASGQYGKHLQRLQERLERSRESTIKKLENCGLETFAAPEGGMFVLARFGASSNAAEIASLAAAKGIILGPGNLFRPHHEPSPWLRFNVAFCDNPSIYRFLNSVKMRFK